MMLLYTFDSYQFFSLIIILFLVTVVICTVVLLPFRLILQKLEINSTLNLFLLVAAGIMVCFLLLWLQYNRSFSGTEWKVFLAAYLLLPVIYFTTYEKVNETKNLSLPRQIKIYSILFFLVCVVYLSILLLQERDQQTTWYATLPDCPCENPDVNSVKLNDGWAKDKGNLEIYHKGATVCFRNYPPVQTSAGFSAQQCCYDDNGKLIKEGAGAGTPDKISSCDGEDGSGEMNIRYIGLPGHFVKDVIPFRRAGTPEEAWKKYNLEWVPNKGDNCR